MATSTIRWAVVLTLCSALGLHNGSRFGPTTLVDELRLLYGVDYAGVGNILGAYTVTYAFAQLSGGFLTDRFGSRRLLLIGLAIMVGGSSLFALTQSLWLALTGRILMGVAGGLIFSPAITYCFAAFDASERGRVMGYAQSGTGVGLVLSMSLLPLIFEWLGLTAALLAYPLIAVVLWIATWRLLEPVAAVRKPPSGGLARLARTRDFWLMLLGFACMGFLSQAGVAAWLPTYLRLDYGFSPVEAGMANALVSAGLMVFPTPFGMLADRVGKRKTIMLIGSGVGLLGSLILLATSNAVIAIIGALVVTASMAATLPMQQVYASERFAAVGAGTALGLINSGAQIANSLGGPIYGSMLDLGWGFSAIWALTIVFGLVRLGAVLLLAEPSVANAVAEFAGEPAVASAPTPEPGPGH